MAAAADKAKSSMRFLSDIIIPSNRYYGRHMVTATADCIEQEFTADAPQEQAALRVLPKCRPGHYPRALTGSNTATTL